MPTILLFVVGAPLVGTWMLGRAIEKRGWHDDVTNYRFAVLIGGYTHKHWYWALLVFARKLFMCVVAAVMVGFGTKVQYLMAIVVILAALTLQVSLRPFSTKMLNFMENSGLICLFLSMYFGILFFWDSFGPITLGFIGDGVVAANILYIAWLFRCLAQTWLWEHEGSYISQKVLAYETKAYFFIVVILAIPLIVFFQVKENMETVFSRASKFKGLKKTSKLRGRKAVSDNSSKTSVRLGDGMKVIPAKASKNEEVTNTIEKDAEKEKSGQTSIEPAKLWTWDGTLVDARGKEKTKSVNQKQARRRKLRQGRRVSKFKAGVTKIEGEKKRADIVEETAVTDSREQAVKDGPISISLVMAAVDVTESLAKWFVEKRIQVVSTLVDILYELGVEEGEDMADLDKSDIEKLSAVLQPHEVKRFKHALKDQIIDDCEDDILDSLDAMFDGEDTQSNDEKGIQSTFGTYVDPLSADEISSVRDTLTAKVMNMKRLKNVVKYISASENDGICRKDLRCLLQTAIDDPRILADESINQIWESSWMGIPHGPLDDLNLDLLGKWLFENGAAAPQKIDD